MSERVGQRQPVAVAPLVRTLFRGQNTYYVLRVGFITHFIRRL